jgi:hypothetical protein
MLQHWHEFYLLLGTAAAALVALLFVAVSVAASFLGQQRAAGLTAGIRTYLSPVVFHFTAVVILSLIALVPGHSPVIVPLILAAAGAAAAGYAGFIAFRVIRHHAADIPDRLGYGIIPAVSYLGWIVAAVFIWRGAEFGPDILAVAAVALLLTNIRNAWDLMLSLARRTAENARVYGRPED